MKGFFSCSSFVFLKICFLWYRKAEQKSDCAIPQNSKQTSSGFLRERSYHCLCAHIYAAHTHTLDGCQTSQSGIYSWTCQTYSHSRAFDLVGPSIQTSHDSFLLPFRPTQLPASSPDRLTRTTHIYQYYIAVTCPLLPR